MAETQKEGWSLIAKLTAIAGLIVSLSAAWALIENTLVFERQYRADVRRVERQLGFMMQIIAEYKIRDARRILEDGPDNEASEDLRFYSDVLQKARQNALSDFFSPIGAGK